MASRRLIDQRRADGARSAREEREARAAMVDRRTARSAEEEVVGPTPLPPAAGGDDTLAMLLLCCHPGLTPPSQVALTLRSVAGLSTRQVATAFLVPESTMAQRLSRARATLRESGARLDEVPEEELPARLAAVLRVLLLVFTGGTRPASGSTWSTGPSRTRRSGSRGTSSPRCPTTPRRAACSRCCS